VTIGYRRSQLEDAKKESTEEQPEGTWVEFWSWQLKGIENNGKKRIRRRIKYFMCDLK
jgi:hypothetical protein